MRCVVTADRKAAGISIRPQAAYSISGARPQAAYSISG